MLFYYSGGTKLVFIGINFDVVPITLDIDIVNISTSRTVLTMHYNIVSDYGYMYDCLTCDCLITLILLVMLITIHA